MTRLQISAAAAALLRGLLARASLGRDRILLTECRSTDWQSLTFVGERHEFRFRITGPHAEQAFESVTHALEDAEFAIAKQVVADIAVHRPPERARDGSISFGVEALTIAD